MTRTVGAVVFADSSRLYLVFDETANAALRQLFPSESAAREWLQSADKPLMAPKGPLDAEEAVTLIMDISLEQDPNMRAAIRFASRAARQALWLTGPRSFLEMAYENGATASREF